MLNKKCRKMGTEVKKLFEEYNLLPKSPQRTKLGRKIRNEKRKLIEKRDYVGIIYILRFMGDYEKDRLFLDLLEDYPLSSLFVLAFANSEMNSYSRAYEMEKGEYEDDEEALRKDIELTLDTTLCKFLSAHDTKDDFNYVQELTDGATWLESNKRSMRGLFWESTGTGSLSFGSFFYKKTPIFSEFFNVFLNY